MASLIEKGAAKEEISSQLFAQISWSKISFVDHTQHQLLERAKDGLEAIVTSPADAKKLVEILMSLAESTDSLVQQYAFTRIEEVLGLGSYSSSGSSSSAVTPLFLKDNLVNDAVFLKVLESARGSGDSYLEKSASLSLAFLMSDKPAQGANVAKLVNWINSKLQSEGSQGGVAWEVALPALATLARKQTVRPMIIKLGCLGHVVSILKRLGVNGNAQQLYDLTFVLWTLSLGQDADLKAFLSAGTINLLVELVAAAPSRKVTRVAVAALVNLALREVPDVLMEMFSTNLQKLIDSMIQSNSYKLANDPEFETDVKSLYDVLVKNYRELSTFERWATEVQSGNLRWGIVHTEKFWRENFKAVEQNEFVLLKSLIQCLQSSDATIVCIALYDLGEFARFYPNGRLVVNTLGGKEKAMTLIGHSNAEIQRQALQSVSKIMVSNWDMMK